MALAERNSSHAYVHISTAVPRDPDDSAARGVGASGIARRRRPDEPRTETGTGTALTYDDFRENAHRREGYAARDVPEPRRVPEFRYDPLNVVYHRVGSHHRVLPRGRTATRWLSGRSGSGLPARNRPLFRNAWQPSSWRFRAMFRDASHVAARATSRDGASRQKRCVGAALSGCTFRTFSRSSSLAHYWPERYARFVSRAEGVARQKRTDR